MVHGWRKFARELEIAAARPAPSTAAVPAKNAASLPQFVPVTLTSTASTPTPAPAPADIQIELRRGATAVKIIWPVAVAADCAAWMRELLR
jgi:transposase